MLFRMNIKKNINGSCNNAVTLRHHFYDSTDSNVNPNTILSHTPNKVDFYNKNYFSYVCNIDKSLSISFLNHIDVKMPTPFIDVPNSIMSYHKHVYYRIILSWILNFTTFISLSSASFVLKTS